MKRVLALIFVFLVAFPACFLLAAHLLLNGDAVRARVVEAVRKATGRELTIGGPVELGWSLTPTIEARDVSLLNPPGMSRPATAHIDRVEAKIALLPLLFRRVEVRQVVLIAPDILLERDAAGRPNWSLARPEPDAAASAEPGAPSTSARFVVVLGEVEVRSAQISWHGSGARLDATMPQAGYVPDSGRISGQLSLNGMAMALNGTAGPIASGAWPLDLALTSSGITAKVTGTSAEARATVLAPDLAALGPLAGRILPSVRDVKLSATLSRDGGREIALQAGAADIGAGLRLVSLSASAPALGAPVTARAEAQVGSLPIAVTATAGSLASVLGGHLIPLTLAASAGDASISAQGTASDLRGSGLDLVVSGRAPDLARLAALAGVAVPPLREVTLEARFAPAPAGLLVRGLRLTSAQGDVAGDLAAGWQPRPSLRGSLVSQRLLLDDWVARPPPAAPAAAAAAGPSIPAPTPPERVIPDLPIPFAALRRADADLHASVGEIVWRGTSYRAVDARLLLQDGKLRLDPVSTQGPGGAVRAQIYADAAAEDVAIIARAPGLAAGPALSMLGAPESTKGTLDLDLELRGRGATLRAAAATLDGHVGIAVVDGEVENRWLEQLFAGTLREAGLPVETGGTSRVRCAAVRVEATSGQVRLRALALDTTRLRLEGDGAANLADETLDLHLRPQLRLGTALSVPIRIGGTLRRPKVALDAGAIAPGRVGITIGGPPPADACGPALAAARDGQSGPSPSAPEPATRPLRPADLLRGLLR